MKTQRLIFKWLAIMAIATLFFQFPSKSPIVSAEGENPSYAWHTFFGSSSYIDTATGITADNNGNVYVSGGSAGPWNGPGGVSPLRPYPYSPGYIANVIVKYNSAGAYQWHSSLPLSDGLSKVKVDASGNVYLVGEARATFNGPGGEPPIHPLNTTYGIPLLVELVMIMQWTLR